MTLSELAKKEVINIRDCKKLGHVTDLEFDERTGGICQITVGSGGLLGLLKPGGDCCIRFPDIRQIGPDIILVDLNL